MYAFSGRLLDAVQLRMQLADALACANAQISLGSAYLKVPALEWFAKQAKAGAPVRVLTRWQPGDLASGSSDLEAYELARSLGWTFYIQEDFHGKVYLVDQIALFVGSANLTSRGLNLPGVGNDEVNVKVDLSPENNKFVDRLFDRATLVSHELYSRIKTWLALHKDDHEMKEAPPWPQEIAELLRSVASPDKLFVAECFQTDGAWMRELRDARSEEGIERDLSLLGVTLLLGAGINPKNIGSRLQKTKMYAWLYHQLNTAEGKEMFFGSLTSALHDSLLDDPAPYRSEVKKLVSNLLGWVERSGLPGIRIDRPNYSQRVSLTSPTD